MHYKSIHFQLDYLCFAYEKHVLQWKHYLRKNRISVSKNFYRAEHRNIAIIYGNKCSDHKGTAGTLLFLIKRLSFK